MTGHSLIKSFEITCSNWEQAVLSDDQILYAARDAIAGLIIFEKLVTQKLIQKGKTIETDDIMSTEEGKTCAYSLCQGVIDYCYKDSSNSKSTITPGRTSAYNIRQSPLYHNCQLIAPDGTLLSTVDIKKVEWYLSKGLGGECLHHSYSYLEPKSNCSYSEVNFMLKDNLMYIDIYIGDYTIISRVTTFLIGVAFYYDNAVY